MPPKKHVKFESLTLKEIFIALLGKEVAKEVLSEIHSEIKKGKKGEELRSAIVEILANHKVTNVKLSSVLATIIPFTMGHPRAD